MSQWTKWQPFPDPRLGGFLKAPIGAGCYQVRRANSKQLVLFGMSTHVALRLTSLLPPPYGRGRRNNFLKREYVRRHIRDIEYRTVAFKDANEARARERELIANKAAYIFKT